MFSLFLLCVLALILSVPVIAVQSGYAQNNEFANQFPSANSGQGSGIGNLFPHANPGQGQGGIGNLPPANPSQGQGEFRSPNNPSTDPRCTKEVDAHTKKLKSLVVLGRINFFWGGVAADNLARFMEGKGGVKYIDSEWLRSFYKVKEIEDALRKDINSRVEQIAPTLADGQSRSVSYSVSPQVIFNRAFYFTELYWASGTSTIKISVTLDLSRVGGIVKAHADVFLDWRDRYDWDPFKSVVIPGYGRIYDRANEMLQVCKGAKPFSMASSWKLNFDTSVRVAEEPAKPRPDDQPECNMNNAFVVIIKQGSSDPKNPNGGYDPQSSGGGCVVWRNQDNTLHTATSGDPGTATPDGRFDSGLIQPGQSSKPVKIPPGGGAYFCTLHPFLTGNAG